MNSSIVSQPKPKNQAPAWPWLPENRRHRHRVRDPFDPYDRLFLAIAAQAIVDLVAPPPLPRMTAYERHSAFVYLCQHRRNLIALGIREAKLDFLAEWLEVREEAA